MTARRKVRTLAQRDVVGAPDTDLSERWGYERFVFFKLEQGYLRPLQEASNQALADAVKHSVIGTEKTSLDGQDRLHDLVVVDANTAKDILRLLLDHGITPIDLRMNDARSKETAIDFFRSLLGFKASPIAVKNHFRLVAIDLASLERITASDPDISSKIVTRDTEQKMALLLLNHAELDNLLKASPDRLLSIVTDGMNVKIVFPTANRDDAMQLAKTRLTALRLKW